MLTLVLSFGYKKLSVGGMAEKIISALHSVQSEHSAEDSDLSKCKEAVRRVGKMEKDVAAACMQGKCMILQHYEAC